MAILKDFTVGFYKIPLPVVLSDSTHGEIKAFELVTIRARDADGAEGTGYTYTVGRNGGAIANILRREIPEIAREMEADDTEQLWYKVWWALHYGGRLEGTGAAQRGMMGQLALLSVAVADECYIPGVQVSVRVHLFERVVPHHPVANLGRIGRHH